MHDEDIGIDGEEEQVMAEEEQVKAYLAPLSSVEPAARSSRRSARPAMPRRAILVTAAVLALGGGAAVAATTSNDPENVTVIEQDGSTHPGLRCKLPDIKLQEETVFQDANGIPGLQPGEPCPTIGNPSDSETRSPGR